jgi:hypothetical protein
MMDQIRGLVSTEESAFRKIFSDSLAADFRNPIVLTV